MKDTKFKIVADSSADLTELKKVQFTATPMKVVVGEREYVDNESVDIAEMTEYLRHYKGKSSSSCPNQSEWLEAFADAQYVFCVAITSQLSGSYNAACLAKKMYEGKYPERRVCVINSLSAGPEMTLIVEKLEELIAAGGEYEDICRQIADYQSKTGLIFMLESLKNFANNGRVSPLLAKAVGILGIRLVGRASDEGTLEPLDKCRGEKRALDTIIERLTSFGYKGGKLSIAHCFNENAANKLKELVCEKWERAKVEIHALRALCSFYAEKGGLLVGYERA